jgi:hypothetical protein
MSDKVPPKAKKDKAEKKPAGPKPVANIGHNSNGEISPEAVNLINEIMAFQDQKKSIAKAERDCRNRLKTEFGILSTSVAREVALRKLDPDVRVQVESNHEDFKKMLGYQPQLDFVEGTPTKASQKAQPSEAALAGGNAGAGFEVNDDEDDAEDKQPQRIEREG